MGGIATLLSMCALIVRLLPKGRDMTWPWEWPGVGYVCPKCVATPEGSGNDPNLGNCPGLGAHVAK